MDLKEKIQTFKEKTSRDVFSKWHMDSPAVWEKPWVKVAFGDVKDFLISRVAAKPPPNCAQLDVDLMEIMARHHHEGEMSACQSIFVALLLEAVDTIHPLETYGYRCHVLSYLMWEMPAKHPAKVRALLHDPVAKARVMSFFDLA